jgi:hypothetical protein
VKSKKLKVGASSAPSYFFLFFITIFFFGNPYFKLKVEARDKSAFLLVLEFKV